MSLAAVPTDPEIDNFAHLDDIFSTPVGARVPQPVDTRPGDVCLFTGHEHGAETAALYVNGVLHASGSPADLVNTALVLLGANVYTGGEHLLGRPDGPAAPDLNTIGVYVDTVEKVETLRRDAEALRAEADHLEGGIKA